MASDWVTLARRLCEQCEPEGGQHSFYMNAQKFWLPSNPAENALVGETLRVAAERYLDTDYESDETTPDHDFVIGKIIAISVFKGDARATACIELLDAVGYPASS